MLRLSLVFLYVFIAEPHVPHRFLQVALSHRSRSVLPSVRGTRSRSDETEKGRLGGRVRFFFFSFLSSSSSSSLLLDSVLKSITPQLKFDTIILFLIWPRHQGATRSVTHRLLLPSADLNSNMSVCARGAPGEQSPKSR